MVFFLDSNALVKRYHCEGDSDALRDFFAAWGVKAYVISQLSKVEFASAIWKKANDTNEKNFDAVSANALWQIFKHDLKHYHVIPVEPDDWENAWSLLERCNKEGYRLRTLDALQLAVVKKMEDAMHGMVCFDKNLKAAAEFIGVYVFDTDMRPPTATDLAAAE